MKRIEGLALFVIILLLPAPSAAGTPFQGHACIPLGKETDLRAARPLAHSTAIRRAIEATGVLDEVPTQGQPGLVGDILQILRSGHVEGIRVLDHTETDEAVCETIEVRVDPDELRRAVRRELLRRTDRVEEQGLGLNGCLRILAVEEEEDRYGRRVTVVVQAERATGPLHTPENRRSSPCFKVCIDYLGPGGVPLDGDALYIDQSAEGVLGGEIRTMAFHAPEEVQSYRVWLPPGPDRRPAAGTASGTQARDDTPRAARDGAKALRAVEAIEVENDTDVLRLDLVSDGPITRHTQFYMDSPPRLVVDLPGRWRRPGFHARSIESALVERVRIGYHPGKLRLVLDLQGGETAPAAVIRETPDGMAIEIRSR